MQKILFPQNEDSSISNSTVCSGVLLVSIKIWSLFTFPLKLGGTSWLSQCIECSRCDSVTFLGLPYKVPGWLQLSSVEFSSVAQSCPTLCSPMNHSTPGLPVHHQFPQFTQTHVHRVGDAHQPSHPLSSPFPPGPNLSQHQGFFQ